MKTLFVGPEGSYRRRTINQAIGYSISRIRYSKFPLDGNEVAKKLGISQSAYSRIETGAKEITVNDVASIALLFGIPPADILREALEALTEAQTASQPKPPRKRPPGPIPLNPRKKNPRKTKKAP